MWFQSDQLTNNPITINFIYKKLKYHHIFLIYFRHHSSKIYFLFSLVIIHQKYIFLFSLIIIYRIKYFLFCLIITNQIKYLLFDLLIHQQKQYYHRFIQCLKKNLIIFVNHVLGQMPLNLMELLDPNTFLDGYTTLKSNFANVILPPLDE